MEAEPNKTYILEDIMRKRRRNDEAIASKLANKLALRGNRKQRKKTVIIGPEKLIKRYRNQQKSYAYLRAKVSYHLIKNSKLQTGQDITTKMLASTSTPISNIPDNTLLLIIRIRGAHSDISTRQRSLLSQLHLRQTNTAIFLRSSPETLANLALINNYITWGQPSRKIVSDLLYRKLYANVAGQRVQIKSNEQIESYFAPEKNLICIEDLIEEIINIGPHFDCIVNEFIFPFKLTTPEGTLPSRLRKPLTKNGHWGYRGSNINEYIEMMI